MPSRPYARVSTNHAFVGAVPKPPLSNRPYKSICRGGCNTSRPYKQVFVGAVQSRTAPTVRFSAKKFKFTIQIRPEHCLFPHIPSSVHVAERPATNVPNRLRVAEHPATNVPNRVRVAERPATSVRVAERPATATTSTRVFYKLQLQIQFTRIYTVHH